jgi:valyl-tRNA synthetase
MSVGDERLIGKKVNDARTTIVEWLKSEGLMTEEKEITQNISTAERTGGIVEPLPKLQWFVAVNKEFTKNGKTTTFKQIMKDAVSSGKVEIIPDHFSKTYFHWIDNLKDWCISRQIWYGHRIPVWYKKDAFDDKYVDINPPNDIQNWEQDPDTLDTWFSSGLWTFSTLGWPTDTKDLVSYHPTNLLVTAYEILFFWVARMILMTGYALDQIPFNKVLITGVVRDAKGIKFSKSLGNGIDPIDMANKYGMDATRMALIYGTTPGTDMRVSEDKIKGYRNFANKLWNISRFILTSCDGLKRHNSDFKYSDVDTKLIDEQNLFIKEITKELEEYRPHIVAEKLYSFAWHTLADQILEESKTIFTSGDEHAIESRKNYLLQTLENILTLLHPFMPFVTEELWSLMPWNKDVEGKLLMISKWPQV